MNIKELIGKTESEARVICKEKNIPIRKVSEDGEYFFVTMDLNPNRINIEVNKGLITNAEKY